MSTKMTPVDIFNSLTTKEKQKALEILRNSEPSPCERLGHKYRVFTTELGWFATQRKALCERCGKQIQVK